MSERITNGRGVESIRRDFRGQGVPDMLPRHLLGLDDPQNLEVRHTCPECGLGTPSPFCAVCLGAGTITADRLERHANSTFHEA